MKEAKVDWSSTCGNLVAAAAQFSLESRTLRTEDVSRILRERPNKTFEAQALSGETIECTLLPLRILAADTGRRLLVNLPIMRQPSYTLSKLWEVCPFGEASIAGVPGTSAGITIEAPLSNEGEGWLPTGKERDFVEVEGHKVREIFSFFQLFESTLIAPSLSLQIECTIVDAGLPTIFVPFSTPFLSISQERLLSTPADFDNDKELMERLEKVRQAASALTPGLQQTLCSPAPKICLVAPPTDYASTDSSLIDSNSMDIFIKCLSSGVSSVEKNLVRSSDQLKICFLFQNLHRTVPATALSALAVASALKDSTVAESLQGGSVSRDGDQLTLRVGQPAGEHKDHEDR